MINDIVWPGAYVVEHWKVPAYTRKGNGRGNKTVLDWFTCFICRFMSFYKYRLYPKQPEAGIRPSSTVAVWYPILCCRISGKPNSTVAMYPYDRAIFMVDGTGVITPSARPSASDGYFGPNNQVASPSRTSEESPLPGERRVPSCLPIYYALQ